MLMKLTLRRKIKVQKSVKMIVKIRVCIPGLSGYGLGALDGEGARGQGRDHREVGPIKLRVDRSTHQAKINLIC